MILHWAVLIATGILAIITGADTLYSLNLSPTPLYLKLSLWVCLLLAFEIVISWWLGPRTWQDNVSHLIFLLLAIPYLNIITTSGCEIKPEGLFIIRFLPMLRGAYVLWDMVSLLTRSKITSLAMVYVFLLLVTAVFASMLFFIEERPVNPDVPTYQLALWWAVMNMTTSGCYIPEITATGKALSVVLSALGIMVFPVFTVYIAHLVSKGRDKND